MTINVRLKYFLPSVLMVLAALLVLHFIGTAQLADHTEFGSFDANPLLESVPQSKLLRLKRSITYTDPDGRAWGVPAPFDTDCASIPRLFLSVVGGRCDDVYRDAAIVHDYYCRNFKVYWPDAFRDWQEVHRAFYYGMRARGVEERKAKWMFAAVYHFGPRWEWDGDQVREIGIERFAGMDQLPEDDIYAYVQDKNPSLKEIEDFRPGNALPATYTPKQWEPAVKRERWYNWGALQFICQAINWAVEIFRGASSGL
jgi:Protein of unknown function (DUF1353)